MHHKTLDPSIAFSTILHVRPSAQSNQYLQGTLFVAKNPKRLLADSEHSVQPTQAGLSITKTSLFKYAENFTTKKKKKNEIFR